MSRSALARIRKLEKQKQSLLSEAKQEALTNLEAALAELNALGFNYVVAEEPLPTARPKTTNGEPDRRRSPCHICDYATTPSHDGRSHRSQGADKKPFTATELEARGYTRV